MQIFNNFLMSCLLFSGTMMAQAVVGEEAPDFHAKDLDGNECSLTQYKGKIVVLEWTNPKCPFVRKQYSHSNDEGIPVLPSMQTRYTQPSFGVVWIMIASAAQDGTSYLDAEGWKKQLELWGAHPTAMIIDNTGELAHLYDARRTPEVYIISKEGVLLYRGSVDSLRGTDPNEVTAPANLHWLRNGIENALKGNRVVPPETIPYGCPIR